MIKDVECPNCFGLGRLHRYGHENDPDDDGYECPKCEGTGVIETDLTGFMENE